MDFLSDPEETKEYLPRFNILYILVAVTTAIFFMRLWYLQVLQGTELREFSERNRIKEEKILAPRGMILDREGRVLVDNEPGFEAVITPQYSSRLEATAKELAPLIGLTSEAILKKVQRSRVQNGPFKPVKVKENLSRDEVARVERIRLDNPGLEVNMSVRRSYRLQENSAQLFGYVGEISKAELPKRNRGRENDPKFQQGDWVGKSGLEEIYDPVVRGKDGSSFVQVDAHGREINTSRKESSSQIFKGIEEVEDATPGDGLQLTIDRDLQEATFEAFNKSDRIGGAVAMNPNNGEVLAWVNAPSFDPNEFSKGISPKIWSALVNDPFKPLRNKVIQDHTPPGSTFKAIVALAGLQEGVINKNSTFFCPGVLKFGKRPYHCHQKEGHGSVNVTQALERSCDVFFYKVGLELGIDRIAKYARSLGIGSKTEIKMNNEVAGLMPTTDWKKKALGEEWQPGENLSNAIGQGFILTTPLQMALAFAGIATSGAVYQPFVVKRVLGKKGEIIEETQPVLKRHIVDGLNSEVKVSKENLDLVREGLHLVVQGDRGTAGRIRIPGFELAGKTGTVQLFTISADQIFSKCHNRPKSQRHHGWFVGFAPFEKPEIVVAVLAEHSCSGSRGAAPVAHDMMLAYFKKYHPQVLEGKTIPLMALAPMTPPEAPVKKKKPQVETPDE